LTGAISAVQSLWGIMARGSGARPNERREAPGATGAESPRAGSGARPLSNVQKTEGETRERPSWTITKLVSTGTIVLRFVGPTRNGEVFEFLAALTEMLPTENANVIFDLREMLGHNPETKLPIKTWLLTNKSRLGQVTVVVAKVATIVKMATAVISLASGIKIKIRDDLDGEASLTNL
jgi:hypothetical protein